MTDSGSNIPADARAVLTIDLGALRVNWRTVKARLEKAECAAVIKADAYGLGLEEIAAALIAEGCRTVFVATLTEARRVRASGHGVTIYVLDGLLPGAADSYTGFALRPCLSSLEEIEEWSAVGIARGERLKAAIHIDTGMNRLGLSAADVVQLAERWTEFRGLEATLVMSHLASADTPRDPMNEKQRNLFEDLRALLPPMPASLANSGGTFLGPAYHYDLVRPGIVLYGGRALEGQPNPMRHVVTLKARILQVRHCAEGETIGYGSTYTCDRPSRIATIACGYADGFLRAISRKDRASGAVGFIGPHPVPIVGRVSMDLITADVTDLPEQMVARGGWIEVLGGRTTVDDLTDRAGTIGYELLTRLGRRVHRVYVGQ